MSKEKPEVGDIWTNKDGLTVRVGRCNSNDVFVRWAKQTPIKGGYTFTFKTDKIKIKTFLKDWTYRTNVHR